MLTNSPTSRASTSPTQRLLVKGRSVWRLARLFFANRRAFQVVLRVLRERLTYLGPSALVDLAESARHIEREHREGILIEAGCALGGSALVIAASKTPSRTFRLYDTFGMIPPPSSNDGVDAQSRYEVIASGNSPGIGGEQDTYYGYEENLLEKVGETFRRYRLPAEHHHIEMIQGLYEDTLHVSEPVALAHIDCDWYESVMLCLERIVPHLIPGGILVIDDYFDWSGCRAAVDTYFTGREAEFEFVMKSRLHIIRK
jgi:asparagine synthase (glutamine-hydrolysing)